MYQLRDPEQLELFSRTIVAVVTLWCHGVDGKRKRAGQEIESDEISASEDVGSSRRGGTKKRSGSSATEMGMVRGPNGTTCSGCVC